MRHRGATAEFWRRREAVLGGRVAIPLGDPAAAVEAIAEALGGRQLAGEYVHQMLAEFADAAPWTHDDAGCTTCGTWRHRLEAVRS